MKIIFFLLLTIFGFQVSFSQTKNCNTFLHNSIKFKSDSMLTFNNQLVENNVLPNIRESDYDIEIRLYLTGTYSTHFDLTIFQASGDSVLISTKEIMITQYKKPLGSNWLVIPTANDNYQTRTEIKAIPDSLCYLLKKLKKSRLFTLKGKSAFTKSDKQKRLILDGGGRLYCEIKYKNKLRNFEYILDDGYDTPENIHNIIKVFQQFKNSPVQSGAL